MKTASFDTLRVLVVDDEEHLRDVVRDQLSDNGYRVMTARDGGEAISLVQQHPFDVALLDISMPVKDGFEVLGFIRENRPSVKAIILTGHADFRHSLESKRLGADAFLSKPYEIDELLMLIDRVMSSHQPAATKS